MKRRRRGKVSGKGGLGEDWRWGRAGSGRGEGKEGRVEWGEKERGREKR